MSRTLAAAALGGFMLVSAARSEAQSWETSALFGYTPDASIDRQAPEVDALDARGGFTWGTSAMRTVGSRWGAEVLWLRQRSGLKLGIESGSPTLFEFAVSDLHGNAVYHFADTDAALRPYLFAGAGATFLTGEGQASETKFSWGVGGGIKYFWWRALGVRGQFRYTPVILADEDAGDFCDPFGFCQGRLTRFEFTGGAVFRF